MCDPSSPDSLRAPFYTTVTRPGEINDVQNCEEKTVERAAAFRRREVPSIVCDPHEIPGVCSGAEDRPQPGSGPYQD